MKDIVSDLNQSMANALTIAQRKNNPAGYMHERMMDMICRHQSSLSDEYELGLLVTGGSAPAFHLRHIAYSNPDVLIFSGRDANSNAIQVMQHYSQMSIVVVAMPKLEEKAYRIGFTVSLKD